MVLALCIGILAGCTGNSDNGASGEKVEASNSADSGAKETEAAESQAATGEAKEGGTLLVGLSGDPGSFNPNAAAADLLYSVAQNVFGRLAKLNNDQQIIPDLAKSWEISDDGLVYTFHLNENVKWHDGSPFSSSDVKFTLEAIKKNNGTAVSSLSDITEITTPDNNTVVIKIAKPNASFLGYLAWYGTFILPEHIYSKAEWAAGTDTQMIGTGPFKYTEYKTGVNLTLEKNADFYGKVPYVDKLIYSIIPDSNTMVQSLYNGEIDILVDPPAAEVEKMQADPKLNVKTSLFPSRTYVAYNFDKEPFNKPEVRKALAYALDSDEIIVKALKGQGLKSKHFLSPVFAWAVSDDFAVPGYNPGKAKELLEQAGYNPDKDGNYLDITLDTFQYTAFEDIAAVMKDQLKKAGINLTINVSDYASWEAKILTDRNFQLYLSGGYQGPDVGAVTTRVSTGAPLNGMGYSNPKLDQLLKEGSELVKQEERVAKYVEVQRILSEDVPIFPITEYVGYETIQAYVKGDPFSKEVIDQTSFSEYSYVWLDK